MNFELSNARRRPLPLTLRVLGALELQPMTITQVARCLTSSRERVRVEIGLLALEGLVDRVGITPKARHRPAFIFGARHERR